MRTFILRAAVCVSLWGAFFPTSGFSTGSVPAEQSAASPEDPGFLVTRFVFVYQDPEDGKGRDVSLPGVEVFEKLEVPLKLEGGRYEGLSEGERASETVPLSGGGKARRFGASAIMAVSRAVVSELNRRGIYGVLAAVDPEQLELPVERGEGAGSELRMFVYYSRVAKLELRRRAGSGAAWWYPPVSVGSRILAQAPVQSGELLRKDALQEYLNQVNRFEGRRVESLVAAGDASGTVNLTLGLAEQKRFSAHATTANSGTKDSGEWRSGVGIEARQLLGADDVLSLEYNTSDFQKYQTFSFSEEFGLVFPEVWKARFFASYAELSLSDLGQTGKGFRSISHTLGMQSTWLPEFGRNWRLSFTGGAYVLDAAVENAVAGEAGASTFLVPYVSVGAEKQSPRGRVSGSLQMEYAGTPDHDNSILGTTNPSREAWVSRWNVSWSRRAAKIADLFADKKPAPGGTHEVSVAMRGQVAWDQARLVPHFQGVAGGGDTVRGYRESFAAGDTVSFATAEYRVRLNDLLPGPGVKEERSKPEEAQADAAREIRALPGVGGEAVRVPWRKEPGLSGMFSGKGLPVEVALRSFVDGAQVHVNRVETGFGEVGNRSLLGAGVGLDFVFRGRFKGMLRSDLGFVLNGQRQNEVETKVGASRVHLSLLLVW